MNSISKNNTLLIKGIGILIIISHNFFHLLKPPGTGENEFSYNSQIFSKFVSNIISDPLNSFQFISSYFGHYGVQLFIFISGYGLTVAYGNKKINYKDFILKRLSKLYPAFSIVLVLLFLYQYVIFGMPYTYRILITIFIRWTLIGNLIPGYAFVLSGPFWFYSMIVQLYFCFPLFLKVQNKFKYGLWIIMLVAYLIIFTSNEYLSSIRLSLYLNFIGNTPVFVLGMIMAFNRPLIIPKKKWMVLFVAIFLIGQLTVYSWYFSQISFVLIMIPLFVKLNYKISDTVIYKFFLFTGSLSMYLFAVNGFLRWPWVDLANDKSSNLYSYFYFSIYLLILFLVALAVRKLERYLLDWLKDSVFIQKIKSTLNSSF